MEEDPILHYHHHLEIEIEEAKEERKVDELDEEEIDRLMASAHDDEEH